MTANNASNDNIVSTATDSATDECPMIPLGPTIDLPTDGLHQGRFSACKVEVANPNKTPVVKTATITVELDERDQSGNPFTFSKKYTLAGRGLSNLREDLDAWAGRKLVPANGALFNAAAFLKKRVTVEVKITGSGNSRKAVIESFRPAQVEVPVPTNGSATPQSGDQGLSKAA